MSKTTKSFVDKVIKSSKDFKKHCPVCGDAIEFVKHIAPVSENNKVKFTTKVVGLCRCNRAQIVK